MSYVYLSATPFPPYILLSWSDSKMYVYACSGCMHARVHVCGGCVRCVWGREVCVVIKFQFVNIEFAIALMEWIVARSLALVLRTSNKQMCGT